MAAHPAARQWNQGAVGLQVPGRPIARPGACRTDGCGEALEPGHRAPHGWSHVLVPASTEPPRQFCSEPCRLYGQALAELRSPAGGA